MRPRRDAVVAVLFAGSVAAPTLGPHAAGAQQPTALPAAVAPAPTGSLGTVHGVVYDSLTHRPLAGAVVQSVHAGDLTGARSVAADSAGRFRIDSLAPGRYLVGFYHPLLDLLRVDAAPQLVEVGAGGDTVRVDLGMPDLARVRAVVCGSAQAPTDSSGLLAGRVRDAADATPVPNATVVLTWSELSLSVGKAQTERRRVPVTTGPGGSYVVCGVPAGDEIIVTAAAPGRTSGQVAIELPSRGFVVRDLALGDTLTVAATTPAPDGGAAARLKGRDSTAAPVARGTARLAGTVRDSAGRPVRGARAVVWGTAATATAGDDGTFALGGLPAGTRTLEVRAIGFAMRRVPVDLAPDRAGTVDVRLDKRVATLNPVTVFGKPSQKSLRLSEFFERRRHGSFGQFLVPADLEHRSDVSAALRGMAGIQIVSNGRSGNVIYGRGRSPGPCPAVVILDGTPLPPDDSIDQFVGPQDVAGIEVYRDAAFAPAEYGGGYRTGCSVVLVWTWQ